MKRRKGLGAMSLAKRKAIAAKGGRAKAEKARRAEPLCTFCEARPQSGNSTLCVECEEIAVDY